MSAGECGAQPVPLEGSLTPVRRRRTDMHRDRPHWDGFDFEWPACSQFCLIDHNHGAYRIHMGQSLGPGSVAARAPKKGKPAKTSPAQCSGCLTPESGQWIGERFISSLDRGKCKDREACQARAPQMDLGLEK